MRIFILPIRPSGKDAVHLRTNTKGVFSDPINSFIAMCNVHILKISFLCLNDTYSVLNHTKHNH